MVQFKHSWISSTIVAGTGTDINVGIVSFGFLCPEMKQQFWNWVKMCFWKISFSCCKELSQFLTWTSWFGCHTWTPLHLRCYFSSVFFWIFCDFMQQNATPLVGREEIKSGGKCIALAVKAWNALLGELPIINESTSRRVGDKVRQWSCRNRPTICRFVVWNGWPLSGQPESFSAVWRMWRCVLACN